MVVSGHFVVDVGRTLYYIPGAPWFFHYKEGRRVFATNPLFW